MMWACMRRREKAVEDDYCDRRKMILEAEEVHMQLYTYVYEYMYVVS